MMNTSRVKFLGSLVLAGSLIFSGPAFVWADAETEHPQRDRRMRWMAGPEAPWISFTLKHRDELNLTSEQVSTLEQARSDFEQQAAPIQKELRSVETEIFQLLREADVDLAQVKAKIEDSEKLRSELRYLRVEALSKGKPVLTAEQQDRLKELISSAHGRHRKSQSRGQAS